MVRFQQNIEMCGDCAQSLQDMARFYLISIDELLARATLMGLAQAEYVMRENEAHQARNDAAMQELEAGNSILQ